jgi:hypothetical protein
VFLVPPWLLWGGSGALLFCPRASPLSAWSYMSGAIPPISLPMGQRRMNTWYGVNECMVRGVQRLLQLLLVRSHTPHTTHRWPHYSAIPLGAGGRTTSPRERTHRQAEEAEELESRDRPINAIHFTSELVFLLSSTCVNRTRSLTRGLR